MSQDLEIETSAAENEFREEKYSDIDVVLKRVSDAPCCTVCSKTLDKDVDVFAHPLLKVLVCKSCFSFYNKGDFSSDEDGTDKYCRWCGQGGSLYCCSKCRCAFCRKCVKRNCNKKILKDLEEDDWNCFVCNVKPLWKARAFCWAVIESNKEKSRLAKLKNRAALEKLGKSISIPKSRSRRSRYKSSKSNSESESSKGSERKLRRRATKKHDSDHSSSSEEEEEEEPIQNKKPKVGKSKKKRKSSEQSSSDTSDSDVKSKSSIKKKTKTSQKRVKASSEDDPDSDYSENVSDSDVEVIAEKKKKNLPRRQRLDRNVINPQKMIQIQMIQKMIVTVRQRKGPKDLPAQREIFSLHLNRVSPQSKKRKLVTMKQKIPAPNILILCIVKRNIRKIHLKNLSQQDRYLTVKMRHFLKNQKVNLVSQENSLQIRKHHLKTRVQTALKLMVLT